MMGESEVSTGYLESSPNIRVVAIKMRMPMQTGSTTSASGENPKKLCAPPVHGRVRCKSRNAGATG